MTERENYIPDHATRAGTARYAERMGHLAPGHFRQRYGLQFSSIGMGAYLGETDHDANVEYVESIKTALRNGCNVIDTAINYRMMMSDRNVGQALRELMAAGELSRDEVIVCTKGGYIPYDANIPLSLQRNLEARFISPGFATADEIVGDVHCIAPDYLSHQIDISLRHLELDAIDVYYIHNPEVQLDHVDFDEFMQRLERAFARMEEEVAAGRIRAYGVATWSGLRADETARNYLPLFKLVGLAHKVGGEGHHFRFLQFPYNTGMMEAMVKQNQPAIRGGDHERGSDADQARRTKMQLLAAAVQYGLVSITSSTLMQGGLVERVSPALKAELGEFFSDAQYAIQFNRSTPGVTTTLVGMSQPVHVLEDLAVAQQSPLTPETFFGIFRKNATIHPVKSALQ
jgi:aryl-alcohol dehydrogenase-like predicted oxidoreductase